MYQSHCRLVWNLALHQREEYWNKASTHGPLQYKEAHGSISEYGQSAELTVLKNDFPFLYDTPAGTLTNVLTALDQSYKLFFSNLKKKNGLAGKPRYKRSTDSIPLKFKGNANTKRGYTPVRIDGQNYARIFLDKIGSVRFRCHEEVIGKVKNCMVKKETDGWYITLAVEGEFTRENRSHKMIGIDLGVIHTVTTSEGEHIDMPTEFQLIEERIKFLKSRNDRRKVKFSNSWKKEVRKIAKLQQKLARAKDYFIKMTANKLTTENFLVVLEDLKVKNMTRSAKGTIEDPGRNVAAKSGLNRSILSNNWAALRNKIVQMGSKNGCEVVLVNPKHTSQTCSSCGLIHIDNRRTQEHFKCIGCGTEMNADVNAAINILRLGEPKFRSSTDDKKVA